MDFSDIDNTGGEVQEVESKDSDFGDGDGVNDFDDTYNEMNSGNETMEYNNEPEGDGTISHGEKDEFETTNVAVDDELEDFNDSSDTTMEQEVQAPQEATDNIEQSSNLNTDESVADALADFDDSADGGEQPEETADADTDSAEDAENVDTVADEETVESGTEEAEETSDASETQPEGTEVNDNGDEYQDIQPEELQENAENASNQASSDANQTIEVNDSINNNGENTSDGDIPQPEGNEKNAMFENVSYHQGQNDFGARGTCGPTSIANSLNRVTGTADYTENAVLHNAMDNDLCSKSWNPNAMGGTTTDNVVSIIDNVKNPDSNIHTEVYEYDRALSVDDLADKVDNHGIVAMVGVDSATLWDQRGDVVSSGLFQHTEAPSDHWITVDSPIRDSDGNVTGFNIIDSGGGVDYVDREKFEAMYQGDASHTISDPTAIIISNQGEAINTYATSECVERSANFKGSAVESDGGDPPSEIDAKEAFDVKFAEKREGWVDDDKADSFLATSDMYAQKAVDSGACGTTDDFYKMYETGDYSYSQDFVDKVKEPYLETGASSLVSRRDVINAFDNPRCQHTIGRQEHGNFVTSMKEDATLVYNEDGTLKSSETIEKIKGVDPGKYDDGVYQYSYDSEFVKSCEEKGLVRTVSGDNPGANSLNIPGCQTWAGENVEYSESELLMPSVDVQGYSSDDAFRAIDENGYFEIENPTVVTEEGNRVQVDGTFRIYKLGA